MEHRGTLLVVDRDLALRDVLTGLVARAAAGFTVVPTATLSSVSQDVLAQATVILLELEHPEASRHHAIDALRRRARQAAIVLVAASAAEADAHAALKRGADEYLLRSEITGPGLLRAIRYAVQHRAEAVAMAGQLRQARSAEALFRNAFENAPIGMALVSTDGRFQRVNQGLCGMLGYGEHELLGTTFQAITHPDDLEADLAHVESLLRGTDRSYRMEKRYLRKSGEVLSASLSVTLVEDSGEPPYFISQVEDLTSRRASEAALRQSEEQFQQAQKMEAVGRLAGGVAHDFNNLLTVIRGYGDLVLRTLEDPRQRTRVEGICAAADRAAGLTRQLLAFSRKQVLQPRILDLGEVVRNLTPMTSRLIGADIVVEVTPVADLGMVRADPGQMEQVILNLVVNARDAMPSGGTLTVQTANVQIDELYARQHPPTVPGAYVLLAVSDTGTGMPDDVRLRAFEPFFTTKESGHGTGLGLATVYGIVKQSDGFVWLYSEPDKGTTVKVLLPRVNEPATDVEPPFEADAPGGDETVLLVEDDERVRPILREFLEAQGYRVLMTGGPREALQLARSFGEPIHALITDLVMPGGNGVTLAADLAAVREDVAVVYISGYAAGVFSRFELPPDAVFLEKPFTASQLGRKLREALARR